MTILGVLECINLYIVFKTDLFLFFLILIFIFFHLRQSTRILFVCLFVCLFI